MILKHKIIIQEKNIEMPLIRNRIYIPVSPPPPPFCSFYDVQNFTKSFLFVFFSRRYYLKHTQKNILCGCPDRMSFQAFIGHRRRVVFFLLLFLFYTYISPLPFSMRFWLLPPQKSYVQHSTNRSVTPIVGVNRLDF